MRVLMDEAEISFSAIKRKMKIGGKLNLSYCECPNREYCRRFVIEFWLMCCNLKTNSNSSLIQLLFNSMNRCL